MVMEIHFGKPEDSEHYAAAFRRMEATDKFMHEAIMLAVEAQMAPIQEYIRKMGLEVPTPEQSKEAGEVIQHIVDMYRGVHFALARHLGYFEAATRDIARGDEMQAAQLTLTLREESKQAMESGRAAYKMRHG